MAVKGIKLAKFYPIKTWLHFHILHPQLNPSSVHCWLSLSRQSNNFSLKEKMAKILAFLLILNVLLISAGVAFSGREIPMKDSKNLDKKQPESFIGNDGSFLVPGVGRYMFPRPGTHFDPIHYNPITGTNGGNGLPGIGSSGGPTPGQNYIPGGDDTFTPSPSVEVPIGGSTPPSAGP